MVTTFEVCSKFDFISGDYPIKIKLKKGNINKQSKSQSKMLDYSKINWTKFQNLIE
jgi:hypothetical protein